VQLRDKRNYKTRKFFRVSPTVAKVFRAVIESLAGRIAALRQASSSRIRFNRISLAARRA
jgi:hypothetical protein